jgi:beta-lactamase regulating signal transducer with metallopeptidase domain
MSAESLVFGVVSASAALVAWIATYAVHSTLAIGGAWLLARTRPLRASPPAVRDRLWKTALVAGVMTSAAAVWSELAPLGGRYDASRLVDRWRWNGMRVLPAPREILPASGTVVFGARLPDGAALLRLLPILLLVAWCLYAAVVLARVLFATARARAGLGPREDVTDAAVRGTFDELARGMRLDPSVRLTASERLASPVALGRREICLPLRAMRELAPDEQRGVLAHEAAHLARRDPWWLLLAATLEAVFFFQPLNRLARTRLQHEAEYLADELAVRHTGAPLALARSLARVAEWLTADPAPGRLLAPALAEDRASLLGRVRRLLGGEMPARRGHAAAAVLTVALPLAVLLAAPAFSGGQSRAWGTPAFHWTGAAAPGQTVEVFGTMGSIRAEPADGPAVVVSATRHGRSTRPDITFQVVRSPAGITVCAVYPVPAGHAPNSCLPGGAGARYNTRANDVEVEFLVKVPRGVGFTAATALGNVSTGLLSGPIRAETAAGEVDLATTSWAAGSSSAGNVTARIGRAAWDGTLHLSSASGKITVILPPSVDVDVVAESGTGHIRTDFPEVAWARRGHVGSRASARLGAGGRRLVLRSHTGDVRILRSP